jgi:hypothetical protein
MVLRLTEEIIRITSLIRPLACRPYGSGWLLA